MDDPCTTKSNPNISVTQVHYITHKSKETEGLSAGTCADTATTFWTYSIGAIPPQSNSSLLGRRNRQSRLGGTYRSLDLYGIEHVTDA